MLATEGAAHLPVYTASSSQCPQQVSLAVSIAYKVLLIPDLKASAVPQQGPG